MNGCDPRPEEERTPDQLKGIDVLLKRNVVPSVDFGIWSHCRLQKKLRSTGLQLRVEGVLCSVEVAVQQTVTRGLSASIC